MLVRLLEWLIIWIFAVVVSIAVVLAIANVCHMTSTCEAPSYSCQEDEAIWWIAPDTRGCVHMDVLCEGTE